MRRRVVLLALVALASCTVDSGPGPVPVLPGAAGNVNPQGTAHGFPHGGPVFAIGDSLLRGAMDNGLTGVLALDHWELESLAETGRTARWAADQLTYRSEVPAYVIVVLGSNPGHSADGFYDDVHAVLGELEKLGARHILWIPPHHPDQERYAEKNRILHAADVADPRMVVANWGRVLDEHSEWINSDGIHLSGDGYAALSSFIRDQLALLG
jgi:lysophospholipase L1-like esterase